MIKWIGFIFRAVPYVLIKYPELLYYYCNRDKLSFVKRYKFVQDVIKHVMEGLHVDFHVKGLEKLKETRWYILTPNHQSFLDALSFISVLDDPSTFVAKIESQKYPIVGKCIDILDGLYLDRSNLRQEIKVMQELRKSLNNENKKWVLFPEGTRTTDPEFKMGEFKAGSFKAPMTAKVDIYPVAMWGSFRVLPVNEKGRKRYPIQISILDPITYEDYKDMSTADLAKLVQSKVQEELDKLKENDLILIGENK